MSFVDPLRLATEVIERYREQVDERPSLPPKDLTALREQVSKYDFRNPIEACQLIEQVGELLADYAVQSPNRRYFGLYNPDVVPISVAADAIAAGFNPQLAAYSHSPAANEIEKQTLSIFLRACGMPEGAGAFTSGGSEANMSGVITALTKQFPNFTDKGKEGRPYLYVSAEAHHSFVKIAHCCGLGREAVREVPADTFLHMDPAALRSMIAQDRASGATPFMVVGTAGTTAAGATDPLPEISEICRRERLWFHVDAAWAGAALLSRRLAPYLYGIHLADSVTIDAHKWLSVPMGAGMFFCRYPEIAAKAFGIQTTYMPAAIDSPDPYLSTIQWSRRFIGLKLFMTLAHHGLDGCREMIEHQSEMGRLLARTLSKSGWKIVSDSPYALVCFTHPTVPAKEIVAAIQGTRRAWVSEAKLSHHGSVIRACITNYRTDASDIEALVSELETAVRSL